MSDFLALHVPGEPLLMPNPWDPGSARLLESLGFCALATTSGGFANALGRADGEVTREEAVAHGGALVEAVGVPVSADLENGFGDDPEDCAATIEAAAAAGLAGASIEDHQGAGGNFYEIGHATERVAAAAAVARANGFVLTARAETYFRGDPDLDDAIARLQAYEEAGADVLYAPGVRDLDEIRRLVSSVSEPVNVLPIPGSPSVAELADAGVARISIGATFAHVAMGAVTTAARELLEHGTYGFYDTAKTGRRAAHDAFERD